MEKVQLILRILSVLMGCLLIALGIVRFCYANQLDFIQVLLSVYYILFAIIIILTEFISIMSTLFSFQLTLYGRGGFLIFVGILCFDIRGSIDTVVEKMDLSVGIIVTVFGVLLLVYGCIITRGGKNTESTTQKI